MLATYNLNRLIKVTVDAPPAYTRYFNNEYERISLSSDGERIPNVFLEIVDRLPNLHVREIRFKKLFTFRYCISDLDSDTPRIYFLRHWLEYLYLTPLGAFVQGQILEPVIYLKLLERGVLFLHAAGVAAEGRAFVFPAHGGTGKTTLSLSLVRHGYKLLGDDLLMVDTHSGMVHPYARPLHLFTYNLKSLSVPFSLRAAIQLKDFLRVILQLVAGEKFLISTRAHVDEIMSVDFGSASALERIVFLKREGSNERLELDSTSAQQQAAQAIIESADLNESLFANVHESEAIRLKELEIVTNFLSLVQEIEFINPRLMSSEKDFAAFASRLKQSHFGVRNNA